METRYRELGDFIKEKITQERQRSKVVEQFCRSYLKFEKEYKDFLNELNRQIRFNSTKFTEYGEPIIQLYPKDSSLRINIVGANGKYFNGFLVSLHTAQYLEKLCSWNIDLNSSITKLDVKLFTLMPLILQELEKEKVIDSTLLSKYHSIISESISDLKVQIIPMSNIKLKHFDVLLIKVKEEVKDLRLEWVGVNEDQSLSLYFKENICIQVDINEKNILPIMTKIYNKYSSSSEMKDLLSESF